MFGDHRRENLKLIKILLTLLLVLGAAYALSPRFRLLTLALIHSPVCPL